MFQNPRWPHDGPIPKMQPGDLVTVIRDGQATQHLVVSDDCEGDLRNVELLPDPDNPS